MQASPRIVCLPSQHVLPHFLVSFQVLVADLPCPGLHEPTQDKASQQLNLGLAHMSKLHVYSHLCGIHISVACCALVLNATSWRHGFRGASVSQQHQEQLVRRSHYRAHAVEHQGASRFCRSEALCPRWRWPAQACAFFTTPCKSFRWVQAFPRILWLLLIQVAAYASVTSVVSPGKQDQASNLQNLGWHQMSKLHGRSYLCIAPVYAMRAKMLHNITVIARYVDEQCLASPKGGHGCKGWAALPCCISICMTSAEHL